jgi:hypothetical protein
LALLGRKAAMQQQNQREENYQVLLTGIEDETEERKELFWRSVSERYHLSLASLREIMNRSPVVLARSLSLNEARHLAESLRPLGALVSIDKRNDIATMSLEFQETDSALIALEASSLRKTQSQTWSVTGRVRNISTETLHDVWVLIQLFGSQGDFLTFEEVPLPINPLPPHSSSPFKAIFEGSLTVKGVAIVFKNSGGKPLPSTDHRKPLADESSVRVDLKETFSSVVSAKENERRMVEEQPSPMNPGAEQERGVEEPPRDQKSSDESVTEEEVILSKMDGPEGESLAESNEEYTGVPLSSSSSSILAKADVEMIDVVFPELKPPAECSGGNGQEIPLHTPVLEEASQLLKEITESKVQETEEKQIEEESSSQLKESLPTFPYFEEFRHSVESYYKMHPDHFVKWMETLEREEEGQGALRCLVTILVHTRFNQMTKPEKAFENTRKVTHLILQPNVSYDEIPSLEGTRSFSGDHWKLLFHRALPRIQSIAQEIVGKKQWNARALEQLIQIIPHMSPETSRRAVRWIQQLRIEGIDIDFSKASILLRGALYRVAARLGVVDPQFDYCEGPNSMGDVKIQAFARTAFPEDPLRVEEPMNWLGRGTPEDGGACTPTYPRCEGCLFSGFCPKHYLHLDPSEKGMRISR